MSENVENPLNNGILRDEKGRLLPGSAPINPNGKPKGTRHLSTLLWEALQKKAKDKSGKETDNTVADLVISRLLKDAVEKGHRIDMIFDRIEGQAKQELDITTDGESLNTASEDLITMAKEISAQLKKKKT